MAFGIAIHALAAAIWVGGMFFAYMVLRPSAGLLEAPVRLQLWERVFSRFFPWVWTSVATLLASGLGVVFWGYGGFAAMGTYVHVMLGIGLLMMAIYGRGRRATRRDPPRRGGEPYAGADYGGDRRERPVLGVGVRFVEKGRNRPCRSENVGAALPPAGDTSQTRFRLLVFSL